MAVELTREVQQEYAGAEVNLKNLTKTFEDVVAVDHIDLDIESDAGEEIGAIDAHFFKIFPGGETDPDLVLVQGPRIEQVHLGPQGLVQVGIQLQITEPEGQCRTRIQTTQ